MYTVEYTAYDGEVCQFLTTAKNLATNITILEYANFIKEYQVTKEEYTYYYPKDFKLYYRYYPKWIVDAGNYGIEGIDYQR